MEYDCGFSKGNKRFRYRTGGILINKDKMLFVKSGVGDYFYMVGGAVQMGETSEMCIEREILEETGIHARADHLAVVCENFFHGVGGVIDGFDCHTLEFYYRMSADEAELSRSETDEGEKLVWLSVDEIKSSQIKPDLIKERIFDILHSPGILHIINEIDR